MKKKDLLINKTNSKGITLVALIITVIVLLILATVSIQVLTGDNGLLTKTESAVQSNKDSQEEEKVKLAVSAAQLAGNGNINTENLNKELKANFNDNKEVKFIEEFWNYKGYKIYKNGYVQKILPKEFKQLEYIESTGTQWIDTKLLAGNYIDLSVKIEGNYTHIPNTYEFIFGANANGGPWVFIGYFKSRNSFLVQCR